MPLIGGCGLRAYLQHAPRLFHRGRELLGFLDGVAHRLFEVNIFAAIHGFERDLGVPMIRRRHQHGVDILAVQQLAVIQIAVAAVLFRVGLFALFIHIANRDDLAAVRALADSGKNARQIRASSSHADDADINAIVGADHAPGAGFPRPRPERPARYA